MFSKSFKLVCDSIASNVIVACRYAIPLFDVIVEYEWVSSSIGCEYTWLFYWLVSSSLLLYLLLNARGNLRK